MVRTAAQHYFHLGASKYPEDKSPEEEAAWFDRYYREKEGIEVPAVIGCKRTQWAGGPEPYFCFCPVYGYRHVSLVGIKQEVYQIQIITWGKLDWVNVHPSDFFIC